MTELTGDAMRDELEQENERFQTLVENASDILAVLDDSGVFQYVSQAVERILGKPPEAFEGENVFTAFIHPDDAPAAMEKFAATITDHGNDDPAVQELRMRNSDGDWIWLETTLSNERTDQGYVTVTRDITERKEREQALDRSKERLAIALETADAGVWDWDLTTDDIKWDDSLKALFGIEDGEFEETYEGFAKRVHPEDRERVEETIQSAIERRGEFSDEFRIVRDDAEERWLRSSGRVVADEANGGDRVTGIAVDVTERRERELAMEKSEERLSLALETADAGIWDWRPESDETRVDDSLTRLFGVEPGEFDATMQGALERVHPEDRDGLETALTTAADHQTRFTHEFRIRREDGAKRWLMATGQAVTDDDGTTEHIIGVAVDITERKERETQLLVSDRMLRHNLRNDMNVIRGYAETIRDRSDDDRRSYADKIVETSNGLLAKADKERDIIEVLTDEPHIDDANVAAIVRHVVERQCEAHPEASITFDAPAECIGLVSGRFDEAVTELIGNAVQHSDRESPSITVAVETDENTLTVRIADDGPGVPGKDVAVLAHKDHETPLNHGSGIGLWLVHWIVQRSNGTLAFEDDEPRGTVVTVTVPRADAHADGADDAASHADDGTGKRHQ